MNYNEEQIKPYANVLIQLLRRGKIEYKTSNDIWSLLTTYEVDIRDYLSIIGLELLISKEDGYAFTKQLEFENNELQRIAPKSRLGYEVSIILIVLRQEIEDFDTNATEINSAHKFITKAEILDQVALFLPESNNYVKDKNKVNTHLKKVETMGFLKKVKEQGDEVKYQIHRMIKSKITISELEQFKQELENNEQ